MCAPTPRSRAHEFGRVLVRAVECRAHRAGQPYLAHWSAARRRPRPVAGRRARRYLQIGKRAGVCDRRHCLWHRGRGLVSRHFDRKPDQQLSIGGWAYVCAGHGGSGPVPAGADFAGQRPRHGRHHCRNCPGGSGLNGEARVIGVGVIGYGYWGPNLVRNLADMTTCRVAAVSDLDKKRLETVARRYPATKTYTDVRDMFKDPAVDAVVVATPVSTHFALATAALKAGKHVLVEKPMTETVDDAKRLIDTAAKAGRTLMVDHTFVYTSAVRKIRELVEAGELGELYYYDSVRVNLGLFQRDVNVVWDLAVHDLSIIDYVIAARPRAISATGHGHIRDSQENIAYLTLFFDDNLIAHIHVNWLAPVKLRKTLIGGSKKMIVYDDLEPSEKIKVYDRGVNVQANGEQAYKLLIGYRSGDMWAPQLDFSEALKVEASHFIDCVTNGRAPQTGGDAGLQVVRTLEAASRSIKEQGRPIELT
ncbi:MAG: Gfo/Idh/MocA family oxidoreductase [Proteobacteria bacterium]|nr:Gfo/Idh/MocA family oxidoreductase [Pseudomonadota bacterium]